MDYAKAVGIIRSNLSTYLKDNPSLKSLVIGVSGGIDSALCCVLAKPVCDELGIKIIGRSIPIQSNKQNEIDRARNIGKFFCHDFQELDLTGDYLEFGSVICGNIKFPKLATFSEKIRQGNIKARMRMIVLYDLAQENHGMVLSSDNFTEYLLGYWSICGDVGDFGMIQSLWKTDVYGMADYISNYMDDFSSNAQAAIDECILAIPTDGLGISNSDLDQIQASSYDEVDRILKTWLCKDSDSFYFDEYLKFMERPVDYNEFIKYRDIFKDHPVVLRHERTHFKRMIPINIPLEAFFDCY